MAPISLAPLDIGLVMEMEGWAGFGKHNKPEFWFGPHGNAHAPMHIVFTAENRDQVDKFHETAIAAGGKGNGVPGIRELYHPNYDGAFVYDPDGHNIGAVCHKPE